MLFSEISLPWIVISIFLISIQKDFAGKWNISMECVWYSIIVQQRMHAAIIATHLFGMLIADGKSR